MGMMDKSLHINMALCSLFINALSLANQGQMIQISHGFVKIMKNYRNDKRAADFVSIISEVQRKRTVETYNEFKFIAIISDGRLILRIGGGDYVCEVKYQHGQGGIAYHFY